MRNDRHNQEIACQQVLLEDCSVFSVQWSTFPLGIAEGLTPSRLLERYLGHIRRATLSAIRRLVTIRFLMVIYRELTGSAATVRVLNVNLRQGEPL